MGGAKGAIPLPWPFPWPEMDPAELPRYNKGGDIKGSIPDSATSPMEAAKEGQVHHVDDGIGIAAHYHSTPLQSRSWRKV